MDFKTQQQMIQNINKILQLSQTRGCWKLEELSNIGIVYDQIVSFETYITKELNEKGELNENKE
tara:strand:+ start:357 stop:548 length:192 start_codon:yes stop_codon:yes gene_type:complete